jgi:hypothetical protein
MKWIVSLLLVAGSLSVHAQSCPSQLGGPSAFCDTFDTPQNGGTRSGDLNPTIWGVSRTSGYVNFGNQADTWVPVHLALCDGSLPVVMSPADVRICNGELREASNDNLPGTNEAGTVTTLAMYPKQPFDFAGRTGTIAFDMNNDTHGTHAAWPELWLTDKPSPAPFVHFDSWRAVPAQSLGLRFGSNAQPGLQGLCPNTNNLNSPRWTLDSAVVSRNYVVEDTAFGPAPVLHTTILDCVIAAPPVGAGAAVMNHLEIQVNQSQVDVYAADAGVPGSLRLIGRVTGANLLFTRGLVWLEDVHYNADKGDLPSQREHTFAWDNLAFDGPFTYTDLSYDALDALTPNANGSKDLGKLSFPNGTISWDVLNVPSGITADAVRVLFNFFHYDHPNNLTVTVNGHVHPTAWPYPDTNGFTWRTLDVVIPQSDLVTGTNTVQLGSPEQALVTANVNLVLVNASMGPPPDHTPPMVAVTSPVNGGSIQAGNQVSFTANASDASGIASVQFLDGTTSLGVDTTAPYGVTWNTTGLSGSHTLKALATDGSNQANTAFSTVTVTITVPPPICTTLQASTITWTGTGIAFNPPQTVTICP